MEIPQAERRVTFPEDLWVALQACTEEERKKISGSTAISRDRIVSTMDERSVAVDIVRDRLTRAGFYPPNNATRECPR